LGDTKDPQPDVPDSPAMAAQFQFSAQVLSQVSDMVCGWKDRRSLPASEERELSWTQIGAADGRAV
jgi:hypothetical protein